MDWHSIFHENDLSETFIEEHIHHLFQGEAARKIEIFLMRSSSDYFHAEYKQWFEALYFATDYGNLFERKKNKNIWKEYDSDTHGCYVIETFLTEKEIDFLQNKFGA